MPSWFVNNSNCWPDTHLFVYSYLLLDTWRFFIMDLCHGELPLLKALGTKFTPSTVFTIHLDGSRRCFLWRCFRAFWCEQVTVFSSILMPLFRACIIQSERLSSPECYFIRPWPYSFWDGGDTWQRVKKWNFLV